jgi:hypothetical protein
MLRGQVCPEASSSEQGIDWDMHCTALGRPHTRQRSRKRSGSRWLVSRGGGRVSGGGGREAGLSC